uniref:Uncharacterized protein n=1 Tax=Minutocellus polymorphus TaxID=265543 RepID=A0A7S0FTY9_9STRA|mmetsp:Transcript_7381/g.12218  ORF Transcript_7381/g.12218 Transcript_7381/m.12218 type:complete len:163 (+) Transcript_7381:107-595(+)|eukprot:CAMPEP_0197726280 /NCGR_PEP_ID=MMETSP1434-20131217/14714_1 /TAXON_ID=265543 /ORGANISM="Minutocellus polymorphus, Strain CCMP3303" /LENGTH=162 /DNA_ID=CAMNT_0043312163 /DNA_START=95 /DNA_END=583 /DNA_ORIENTATION=-
MPMFHPLRSFALMYKFLFLSTLALAPAFDAASYGNLEGDWERVDGYTLENFWDANEITRRNSKVDVKIKRINDKGFYEMTASFKGDVAVMHDGKMTKKIDTTWRMVETPNYDDTKILEGVNLKDPATITLWVSNGGQKMKYIYREGGPDGTLVTKTMKKKSD